MSLFRVWVMTSVLAGVAGGQTVLRPPAQGHLVDGYPAYGMPLATGEEVLEEMSGRAAVIFAGAVTAVRLPEDGSGVVEVEFAVSQAVRGVPGETYVVREWAGLWRDGPRYRVGDRRLMLLHVPGPGGLSSPVDGMDGAIPVAAGGSVVSGIAEESVDLRWLEAKTLRSGGYAADVPVAAAPGVGAKPALARVVGLLATWEARRRAGR